MNAYRNVAAAVALALVAVSAVHAQPVPIPPPSGPLAFCYVQTPPAADSYKLIFDGGPREDVTMITPSAPDGSGALAAFCTANAPGWTHAHTLPAARFTVGTHTVTIVGINAFGEKVNEPKEVVVGVAPGPLTSTAVGVLPQ